MVVVATFFGCLAEHTGVWALVPCFSEVLEKWRNATSRDISEEGQMVFQIPYQTFQSMHNCSAHAACNALWLGDRLLDLHTDCPCSSQTHRDPGHLVRSVFPLRSQNGRSTYDQHVSFGFSPWNEVLAHRGLSWAVNTSAG